MSVLGIVGSPRKNGLTALAVQKVLKGVAQKGMGTEILYLAEVHLQPCRDCYHTLLCREGNGCYHTDDFVAISHKITEANGLVLGSPVYYGDITRKVDTLLNKLVRHRMIRPKEGIPAIGLAVSGGGGGGYASALRQIYHYFRILGVWGQKPIPVTRFTFPSALKEAFQAGVDMASLIIKGEQPTGSQRVAAFLDLPFLGFNYLHERFYLIEQIITGAQSGRPELSLETVTSLYQRAKMLDAMGNKAGALKALDDAYKLGTAIWNPERP